MLRYQSGHQEGWEEKIRESGIIGVGLLGDITEQGGGNDRRSGSMRR